MSANVVAWVKKARGIYNGILFQDLIPGYGSEMTMAVDAGGRHARTFAS
jgi:hypothetical protein